MPLKNYSLLVGEVADYEKRGEDDFTHFRILVQTGEEKQKHRISVNVRSQVSPHELKYLVISDFDHHLISKLKEMPVGMHLMKSDKNSLAIDYIRSNIFNMDDMKILHHNRPGENNDLYELIEMYVKRAKKQENSKIYAFGEAWYEENERDKFFNFLPGSGIHDIHMNQGNSLAGKWANDNGVYQDGCLFFFYPETNQWIGVFLAFQSQAVHTDDTTGHPISSNTDHDTLKKSISIISALVDPIGIDIGFETVTLLNISNLDINLSGWAILDRDKVVEELTNETIKAGETKRIRLSGNFARLGNKGGQITLLSPNKLKVHGVSYTESEVRTGWSIQFNK